MRLAKDVKSGLVTFCIGFVAGISPFIFIHVMPTLLEPNTSMKLPKILPVIITGILVGLITTIFFTSSFDKKQPSEIFLYALGIPALLIASVSNISTEWRASAQISEQKAEFSAAILKPSVEEVRLDSAPRPAPPPVEDIKRHTFKGIFSNNTAWAEESWHGNEVILSQAAVYYIVIGTYTNNREAWDAYYKFKEKRLETEKYVQKNLGVFQISDNEFILVYRTERSKKEAESVYRLLRINDPELDARILYTGSSG